MDLQKRPFVPSFLSPSISRQPLRAKKANKQTNKNLRRPPKYSLIIVAVQLTARELESVASNLLDSRPMSKNSVDHQ